MAKKLIYKDGRFETVDEEVLEKEKEEKSFLSGALSALMFAVIGVLAAIVLYVLGMGIFGYYYDYGKDVIEKPVLYLYPEEGTEVSVKISDKDLVASYPAYGNGWRVTAEPDGTLTDAGNREYNYLFWEYDGRDFQPDFSEGFCVKGSDTAVFLEEQLAYMRLSDTEADDFISYWLPRMQGNAYNLISFQFENYDKFEQLAITPQPDCVICAVMAFKALDEPVEIKPQILPGSERTGFVAVEWGGLEVK